MPGQPGRHRAGADRRVQGRASRAWCTPRRSVRTPPVPRTRARTSPTHREHPQSTCSRSTRRRPRGCSTAPRPVGAPRSPAAVGSCCRRKPPASWPATSSVRSCRNRSSGRRCFRWCRPSSAGLRGGARGGPGPVVRPGLQVAGGRRVQHRDRAGAGLGHRRGGPRLAHPLAPARTGRGAERAGRPELAAAPAADRPGLRGHRPAHPLLDTTRARTVLGWKPQQDALKGLLETVHAMGARQGGGRPVLRSRTRPLRRASRWCGLWAGARARLSEHPGLHRSSRVAVRLEERRPPPAVAFQV
jgi:hypothetical protein